MSRTLSHGLAMAGMEDAQADVFAAKERAQRQFSQSASAAANAQADARISYRQSQDMRARMEWDSLPSSTGLDVGRLAIDAPYNPYKMESNRSVQSKSVYESAKLLPGQSIDLSSFSSPEEINLAIKAALNVPPNSEIPLRMILNENTIDRSAMSFVGDVNVRTSQKALILMNLTAPTQQVSDSGIDHFGESDLRKIGKKRVYGGSR